MASTHAQIDGDVQDDCSVNRASWSMDGAIGTRCANGIVALLTTDGSRLHLRISRVLAFGILFASKSQPSPRRAFTSASLPFLIIPLCGTRLSYSLPIDHASRGAADGAWLRSHWLRADSSTNHSRWPRCARKLSDYAYCLLSLPSSGLLFAGHTSSRSTSMRRSSPRK